MHIIQAMLNRVYFIDVERVVFSERRVHGDYQYNTKSFPRNAQNSSEKFLNVRDVISLKTFGRSWILRQKLFIIPCYYDPSSTRHI